ncbi:MAG: DHHA1 domain-containing protein, partial [Candidatus Shapirobacteria bacterium]|nr:DHHA1 domain-containing protein [Candidatus Shapirobacteria bacterium]
VTLIQGDSKLPQYLSMLPGFQNIIEKNISEIDLSKYDLFISLDASSVSQVTKTDGFQFPPTLTVIVIDHHTSSTIFGDLNWVDKDAPATSQLVAEFILKYQKKFSYDQAACLLLGLYTDTGGYKYPLTSSKTFFIASKLAFVCPDYHRYIYEIENNDDPQRLKLIGFMYSNIQTYFGGKVAISTLSLKQLEKIRINPNDIGNVEIANQLKAVVGWEMGITMMETSKNQIKISMRKRQNQFDVSKIAVNTKFGGGHSAAAGATLPYSLPKAKKCLLKIIHQTYPELGEP